MTTTMTTTRRTLAAVLLAGVATAASAHTGHGAHGLADGLAHPLGLDHLLAMLGVGVWAAAALPAGRRWLAPAAFLLLMAGGAAAGAYGVALPLVESGIALSVVLLGAMLMAPRAVPPAAGLAAIAAAAALHGLAHGAEAPAGGSFASYAAGFLLATAVLHGLGLFVGARMLSLQATAWRVVGSALGLAGLALWAMA